MSEDWAEQVAERVWRGIGMKAGLCLLLGAADTGKTTLASALAETAAAKSSVAMVDADIGQSHIGPPTAVGWVVIDRAKADFSKLCPAGISFVGDISPVGHLLQLTAALVQCVDQARQAAGLVIVDTPGFVRGPAACALWWTIHRILKPELVVAVQHNEELADVLSGLHSFDLRLELIECPKDIPLKSSEHRQSYRRNKFVEYFRDARSYSLSLDEIAVQGGRHLSRARTINRLAALRSADGIDLAIGLIKDWRADNRVAVIRSPDVNTELVRCLVIGDVRLEIDD